MWHGGSALVRSGDESGSTLKCCTMHITFNIWRDMCLKAPNHACREECISEAVVSRCRSSCSSGCSRQVWLPPAPPVNLPAATYLDNCVCPPVSLILHLVRLNVDGQKRSGLPPILWIPYRPVTNLCRTHWGPTLFSPYMGQTYQVYLV